MRSLTEPAAYIVGAPAPLVQVMALRDTLKLDMARRLESAQAHTSGMIALIPEHATALRLHVSGYEPVEELHVTLAFLGVAVDWDTRQRLALASVAETVSGTTEGPVVGKLWAAGSFNPYGEEPCAALLVGDIANLNYIHQAVWHMLNEFDLPIPMQHKPWVPHITIGYGLPVTRIEGLARGNVRFDRLRVSMGPEHWDYPLP